MTIENEETIENKESETAAAQAVDTALRSNLTSSEKDGLSKELSFLVYDFLKNLETSQDKYELKNNCRILKEGFFLGERLLHKTLIAFGLHAARVAGGSATVDAKLIKKLLGTEEPALQYLIDGKICIPGFLIPAPIDQTDFKIIQFFRGSLINATEFLHPRDPELTQLPGVEVKLDKTGFGVWLKRKEEKIFADSAAVQCFHKALLASPKLRKRYPEARQSLRAALLPLARLLDNAVSVNKKHLLFIPAVYRTQKDLTYLNVGGFIFIVADGRLLFTYELRGANFRFFVNNELDLMRREKKRKIGRFEISRKRGAIVGAIRIAGEDTVLLHFEALLNAMELMMRRRSLRKRLKSRVTVLDCIQLLSSLLQDTVRVEPHEVPHAVLREYVSRLNTKRFTDTGGKRKTKSHRPDQSRKKKDAEVKPEDLRYRSGNGWIFFMHNKNIVRGLAERPRPKKQQPIPVLFKTVEPTAAKGDA